MIVQIVQDLSKVERIFKYWMTQGGACKLPTPNLEYVFDAWNIKLSRFKRTIVCFRVLMYQKQNRLCMCDPKLRVSHLKITRYKLVPKTANSASMLNMTLQDMHVITGTILNLLTSFPKFNWWSCKAGVAEDWSETTWCTDFQPGLPNQIWQLYKLVQ